MSKLQKSILIVVLVLLVDQILKIWIKTNMTLGQEFPVIGHWFIIHFVENNGMAFGFEFGGEYGKIFLSLFRVIAVFGIGWYILQLIKKGLPMGFIACVSLIFAGAIGKHYRQCLLRTNLQRQLWRGFNIVSRRRWICFFSARPGC